MSYILDALRKSETERRQGKVPDLGQSVQLIHKPKKKRLTPALGIALALVLNALVLAVVLWPAQTVPVTPKEQAASFSGPVSEQVSDQTSEQPSEKFATAPSQLTAAERNGVQREGRSASTDSEVLSNAGQAAEPAPIRAALKPVAESEPALRERPMIIVPSSPPVGSSAGLPEAGSTGRVPHLVELPLSFQKSVPDLTFNSHIYSSEPTASRVMINNQYLRRGDSFSGISVDNITEDGVVLSKQGQRFRVGIVRDWVSPR